MALETAPAVNVKDIQGTSLHLRSAKPIKGRYTPVQE